MAEDFDILQVTEEYNESSIQVLEGLEPVRERPAMYIGDIGERGLHHLIQEVVDNSIDEVVAGYAKHINITLHTDGSCTVEDDGRGIPTGPHPAKKVSTLEVVMSYLHSGAKFNNNSYKVSGGLHGVGVSCVNALSTEFIATVHRDGKIYEQRYSKGRKLNDVQVVGKSNRTGTTIHFLPDPTIFRNPIFKFAKVSERLKELSYLNKGVIITLKDERENIEETYHFAGGLVDFIKYIDISVNSLTKPILISGTGKNDSDKDVLVEICLEYTDSYTENILSYVNNINTIEGGTHVSGFRSALTRVLNTYAAERLNGNKAKLQLTGDDFREGLTAIISVKVPDPLFEGQTKTKLGNSDVESIVRAITNEKLSQYLDQNPAETKRILDKAILAAEARIAARQSRDIVRRKNAFENTTLPGKLSDCSSTNPEECELFIVEGDSAGGSAKQGRDRRFQAILPLKGKILNVEKARLHKILENEEIRAIIQALGTGFSDEFDIGKLRYHKIVLMADADVDGSHIKTLLLTLFYNFLNELILQGKVYIAMPPLYRVKKGKKEFYVYDENELNEVLLSLQKEDPNAKVLSTEDYENEDIEEKKELNLNGITISRFKGLGEMNPDQLWETTMNPEKRTLIQVAIGEAAESSRVFQMLMGEKVEPRREFIEKNAKYVKNLDT